MEIFQNTHISRQLKECNAPESAYLYVENLWNYQKYARKVLCRVREEIEEHSDIIKDILGEK